MDHEILAHYEMGREDARLRSGAGRLEYLRTLDVLERVLPPAPAQVIDVGGGSGIYALPLSQRGYAVTLIDPVPLHVEQAGGALADHAGSSAHVETRVR